MNIKKLENLHIALWLLKDCSWSQQWVKLGMMAAFPALCLQIYMTWQNRKAGTEDLIHNLAVCLWIAANVIWMAGEFFFNTEDKWLNQWFFFSGMALIAGFYIYSAFTQLFNRKS